MQTPSVHFSILAGSLLLLVATACGDAGSPWGRDAGATAPPLSLERVAVVDGHVAEFGEIGALVADEDGRIYVADVHRTVGEIVVLDASGARIGTIGRRGSGPGEFTRLVSTLAWQGDTLVALDATIPRRVLRFTRDGAFVDAAAVAGSAVASRFVSSGPDVAMLEVTRAMVMIADPDRPPPMPDPEAGYAQVRGDGTRVWEALAETAWHVGGWRADLMCRSSDGRAMSGFIIPFGDRGPRRAFTPDGYLAKAHPEEYRIDVVAPATGEVVRTIQRDVPRVQLTDDAWEMLPPVRDIRRYEERYGGPLRALGDGPCPIYAMRPADQPAIRTLISDDQGRLWVEATAPDGFVLALHDADGTLLGETAMPSRDPRVPPFARGDRLFLVTVDELGVQGIEVYRLER
jgi:hypothetical protein